MTPELMGILGVGLALAGLLLAAWRDIRADIRAVNARIDAILLKRAEP